MNTAAELENARALRRLGRHKAAAEICRRILDRQPSRPDALLVLAAIADDLGDQRAAVGFLTRIVDRHLTHPGAAVLLAEVLQKLGATDGTVAWYRAALDTAEDDIERAAPALARLLIGQGDADAVATLAAEQLGQERPALALEVARIGRSGAVDNAALALAEGRALLALDRGLEARSALAAAVAGRPGDAEALRGFGRAAANPAWIARATAVVPDADTQAELGAALLARGRVDEAERRFAAALAGDGAHGPALRGRTRLLLGRGDADGAIGLVRRRLADDPDDAEAARLLGTALTRRGLAASAVTYAQSAARAGRAEIARATAEGIVAAEPDRLDAWREIGTACAFRTLLTREPADAAAMRGLAALADAETKLTWLERAIRIDTGAATALALAQVLVRAGGKDAARALVRPLLADLAARPRPEAAALAALLAELGEVEAAARLFELVIAQDPEDEPIAAAQIEALAKLGEATALTRVGQAHLGARRPRLAAKAFAAVRQLKPENAQIAFLHGRALWDADEKSEAIDAFADAAETAGDGNLDLMNRAGEALVGLQAADLGLRYLRRAVELDFTNPGVNAGVKMHRLAGVKMHHG
jgi:tetratricopeptide (TPR) repeat protein